MPFQILLQVLALPLQPDDLLFRAALVAVLSAIASSSLRRLIDFCIVTQLVSRPPSQR
jgi:hypothetical protein